jgi:O-antigen/teichoic acid export membrane protein
VTTDAQAGADDGHSIVRNAALAFAAQITGAVFTAGLTIFLARKLGTHGYGILSLALGIYGLVLLPTDFGFSNSVARFVAQHRSDRPRVQAVLADGLRLKIAAALALSIALAAAAQPIASAYGLPALIWPIRGVALTLFAESIMLLNSVFVAIRRVDLQLWTALLESVTEVTATLALVLAGGGAAGATFGKAIGYLVGAAVTLFLLARALGPQILPTRLGLGMDARRIATYAGVLLIVDGAYTAFAQIDILIIGAISGASAAAIFSAPMKLVTLFGYPGSAISSGVSPRLARGEPGGPNKGAFLAALRIIMLIQTGITVFVLGWAGLMVHVGLGSGYRGSVTVLRVLAPYIFLTGFGTLVSISVNYLGEAARRVPIALATVAINLVLDLLLVPSMGATGGAIGTDAAYALYAPAHLWICQRMLSLDLRPIAGTSLRALLAGAPATGVLFLFGDQLSPPFMTIIGGVLAIAVLLAILWLSGEVSTTEFRAVLGRVPIARRLVRGGT